MSQLKQVVGLLACSVLAIPALGRAEVLDGRVEFAGVAPPLVLERRDTDPWCVRKAPLEGSFRRSGDGVQDVWVRVVKGAKDELGSPHTTVQVTQRDCTYAPRMAAMQAGNTLVIRNDDPVLHNVQIYAGTTQVFNGAMPAGAGRPPLSTALDVNSPQSTARWEGVLQWKCDVHPWMSGMLGVARNPWFAVTGADGTFRIDGIPPGRYTLSAWHEKLGERLVELTVAPGQAAHAVFRFGTKQLARAP